MLCCWIGLVDTADVRAPGFAALPATMIPMDILASQTLAYGDHLIGNTNGYAGVTTFNVLAGIMVYQNLTEIQHGLNAYAYVPLDLTNVKLPTAAVCNVFVIQVPPFRENNATYF